MNRSEFIKGIMDLYPNTFKKDNPAQYQGWINRYKNAIPENWDFNKLMWYFDNDWTSTIVPPHPSFFRKYREDVKPRETYQPVVEAVENLSEEEKIECENKRKEIREKMKQFMNDKMLK